MKFVVRADQKIEYKEFVVEAEILSAAQEIVSNLIDMDFEVQFSTWTVGIDEAPETKPCDRCGEPVDLTETYCDAQCAEG